MSFAVTQRTREMGVRSALGAQRRQLVALVMRRSLVQLAIGLGPRSRHSRCSHRARSRRSSTTCNPRDPVVLAVVIAALAASERGSPACCRRSA